MYVGENVHQVGIYNLYMSYDFFNHNYLDYFRRGRIQTESHMGWPACQDNWKEEAEEELAIQNS